jgi:hypothetical protein
MTRPLRGAFGKVDLVNYEAPKIVDFGDLVELTAATQSGNYTDKDFPAGTPKDDLTFS